MNLKKIIYDWNASIRKCCCFCQTRLSFVPSRAIIDIYNYISQKYRNVTVKNIEIFLCLNFTNCLNPIKNRGRGGGGDPTSLSLVTSTKVKLRHEIWLLVLTLFPRWCYRVIPSACPKLLNLNQEHPSKRVFFQVKSL